MNEASAPLTEHQNECIELTTRNRISLSDQTKFTTPSRGITIQEKIRQSARQHQNTKKKLPYHKKAQTASNKATGLGPAKNIGILVCLAFLLLPGQTTAAINCR